MAKRKVNLVEELDWRLRITSNLLLFAETHMGQDQQEQIVDDAGMLILECRRFLEDAGNDEGDDPPDDTPGDEGPLGPLPVGILRDIAEREEG